MGLGYRQWSRERLTAEHLQGYLQDQVVAVFASNSERDAVLGFSEIPEGLHVYIKETGRTLVRVGEAEAGSWQLIGPMPGITVEQNDPLNVNGNVWVPVPWDAPPSPGPASDGMFDPAFPTRLIATATGRHKTLGVLVGAQNLQIRRNAAGNPANGTMLVGVQGTTPAAIQVGRDEFFMNLGDHLELYGWRSTSGQFGSFSGYPANLSLSYIGRA